MHFCFAVFRDMVKQAQKQHEIELAQERMRQVQLHNAQYERALKQLVSSDAGAIVHCCFVGLRDLAKEAQKHREFEEARERMLQTHNKEYERALKQLALSDT